MARYAKALLDENWNAMKYTERFALRHRFVGRVGSSQRIFFQLVDESIKRRIVALDSLENVASQLGGRNLLLANGFGRLQCRSKVQIVRSSAG